MSWQYRIMRKVEGQGRTHYYSFGIHEVYSSPKGWTEDPVRPEGDTLEELRRSYTTMAEAFRFPVLDHTTGRRVKS
jgi:hypothetical protein